MPNPFRIVSSVEQASELSQFALRPETLDDFIGQDKHRERLSIALEAAAERHEPIDHVLMSGPPGTGKTSLANIIANEMGSNLHTTSGPAMKRTAELFGILSRIKPGDVLLIDEIHGLPRLVEEYLYPAMEDFTIDVLIDEGQDAASVQFPLHPFTLVGATTRKGLLSAPLRERFGLTLELDFYGVDDLCTIAQRSAQVLGITLTEPAAQEVAQRSRGTPRIANRLIRRVRDYAQVKHQTTVDPLVVARALDLEGIDAKGLDELDRKYLDALLNKYEGRPVGIQTLAATMQQEVNTLEETIEPYLLYAGFLIRTPLGRQATKLAKLHLQ